MTVHAINFHSLCYRAYVHDMQRLSADLYRVADAYSHGTNDCVCKSFSDDSDDIVSW